MENEERDLKEKDMNEIVRMVNEDNPEAILELGIRYAMGDRIKRDSKKAFELFIIASKKGVRKAKLNLAISYNFGLGTEVNEKAAFDIYNELIEKYNDPKSYYYMGEFYYWGGPVEVDYEKAYYYYTEALKYNPNYLKAKFSIAYLYYSGKGIEENNEKAFNIFKELVEKHNFSKAYYFLGWYYYWGKVVEQDYKKAIEYFNEAIKNKQNTYESKYYLGEIFMFGRGVSADYEKAKEYFEDILNEEHNEAYYKLALMYSGKFGIEKNNEKVKEYFNKLEYDLCIAMIFYVIAVKPEESQNLDEIYKLLDYDMDTVESYILHFHDNHPTKKYYNRFSRLTREELDDIVERLKEKIRLCKDSKDFENAIMLLCADEHVSELAERIVGLNENKHTEEITVKNGDYIKIDYGKQHYFIKNNQLKYILIYNKHRHMDVEELFKALDNKEEIWGIKEIKIKNIDDKTENEYFNKLLMITSNWDAEYRNKNILDGIRWAIEINCNDSKKSYYGFNKFPYNWDEFESFLKYIINGKIETTVNNNLTSNEKKYSDNDLQTFLLEIAIYYLLTTSQKEILTLNDCVDILNKEILIEANKDTLFYFNGREHIVNTLSIIFREIDLNKYKEIIRQVIDKIDYYCEENSNITLQFSSEVEVIDFSSKIINHKSYSMMNKYIIMLTNEIGVIERYKAEDIIKCFINNCKINKIEKIEKLENINSENETIEVIDDNNNKYYIEIDNYKMVQRIKEHTLDGKEIYTGGLDGLFS